ncbi:hypothetical protein P4639_22005 [Priestia megaterium]|uniref:hypothetical protein n=1 Tax=Priestia megaterium TaxID=1404 RepID=UPI002E1B0205|nr:hypothetical protein [Priestia megaterium]
MLKSYKGRQVKLSQRVSTFWNLHQDVFSMQATIVDGEKRRTLVVAHCNEIILQNVSFVVRKAGRERVLKERQKNIHAFVKGEFMGESTGIIDVSGMREAYYNPFKQDCFTDKETGEKLIGAELAILKDKKVYYK